MKGRDGHGRVELLHLVGEKGGKREPFVRDSGDEESIEEEEGTYGVRRRFEKAWKGVVRQRSRQETERESKEGLREGQTKKRQKESGATKKLDRGIGLLIPEGSCFSLSRHSLMLSTFVFVSFLFPLHFPFVPPASECKRVSMFMRVQETRVRGYANRMIDTLAGRLPSRLIFYSVRWIDFLWHGGEAKNGRSGMAGACNESRILSFSFMMIEPVRNALTCDSMRIYPIDN